MPGQKRTNRDELIVGIFFTFVIGVATFVAISPLAGFLYLVKGVPLLGLAGMVAGIVVVSRICFILYARYRKRRPKRTMEKPVEKPRRPRTLLNRFILNGSSGY